MDQESNRNFRVDICVSSIVQSINNEFEMWLENIDVNRMKNDEEQNIKFAY